DFEAEWRRWLHDGVIPDTAFREINPGPVRRATLSGSRSIPSNQTEFEIAFRLDPSVADGRFANNGWLQELPKPVTQLTWDNAVIVSPGTAARLGISTAPSATGGEHGQTITEVVELRYRGRAVRGLAFPIEGHPDH